MHGLAVDLPPLQGVPEDDTGLPQPCHSPDQVTSGLSSPISSPSRYSDIDGSEAPDLELILAVKPMLGARTSAPFRPPPANLKRSASFSPPPRLPTRLAKSLSFGDDVSYDAVMPSDVIQEERDHQLVLPANPGLWKRFVSIFSSAAKRQRRTSKVAGEVEIGAQHLHLNKLLVHRDLLKEHSAHFAREIRRMEQLSDGKPAVLVLEVNAQDVLLTREVISFMYTQHLPADLNASCLIKLALLADQYEVELCLEACIRRLGYALQKDPEVEHLVQALHLPNQVRSATKLTGVTSIAVSCIKTYLMDLEKAWEKEALRNAFVALPFEVVRVLVESPMLEVTSENTALVAVCSWLHHNYREDDPEGSQREASQLLHAIRFQNLTHSFLSQVATLLPWVTNSKSGHRSLMEALQYTAASSVMKRALEESRSSPAARQLPRQISKRKHLKFTTFLQADDLKAAADIADAQNRTQLITSSRHHFQGCCLRFQLEVAPLQRINPARGRIYGGLHWSLGIHPHQVADSIEGLADVQIRLVFEIHIGEGNGSQLVYSNIGKKLAPHKRCTGWPELLQNSDPAEWGRYADRNGRIVVKVVAFECE